MLQRLASEFASTIALQGRLISYASLAGAANRRRGFAMVVSTFQRRGFGLPDRGRWLTEFFGVECSLTERRW
jgi:hypothetical protein